jgi:hypothetical protein
LPPLACRQRLTNGAATKARHPDIEEQQIRPQTARDVQQLLPVSGSEHPVSGRSKPVLNRPKDLAPAISEYGRAVLSHVSSSARTVAA